MKLNMFIMCLVMMVVILVWFMFMLWVWWGVRFISVIISFCVVVSVSVVLWMLGRVNVLCSGNWVCVVVLGVCKGCYVSISRVVIFSRVFFSS